MRSPDFAFTVTTCGGAALFLISLAVFGFNLFGDSVRDALDPKLRSL